MKSYPTGEALLQLLDDNDIDYVISERFEGVIYLGFTLDDTFKPGAQEDWEPRLCGEVTTHGPISGERTVQQWAIFNKKTGKEWQYDGDCLAFESEIEARSYLSGFFDAWESKKT